MIYKFGNKRIFRILCAIIALCFVVPVLSSCSALYAKTKSFSISDFLYSGKGDAYHSFSENFEIIAESASTCLYYDRESMSIAVFNRLGGNSYYALPECSSTAAVLKLTAVSENGTFHLNSQDNSVCFGTAHSEPIQNGIRISYTLSNDKITAEKPRESLLPGELFICASVEYTLSGEALFTRINCSDIFISEGYEITELSVCDNFGAIYENAGDVLSGLPENSTSTTAAEVTTDTVTEAESETDKDDAPSAPDRDFIFVPDGCGALMYTDSQDEKTNDISLEVYGDDAGTGESGNLSACFPAYGIKHGNGAFVSVINSGAALATITASRSSGDNGEGDGRVGAFFRITPSQKNGKSIYFGERYNGEILLCTKFLSGDEATYIGMAAACREEFIRTGVLPAEQLDSDDTELNLSVIVSADGTNKGTVSRFGQIEDTLVLLKAKGVDNVKLILKGALSGGLIRDSISDFSLLRCAGGANACESLYSYAEKQNFDIYIGTGIITQTGSGAAASNLGGGKIKARLLNPLYPYYGENYLSGYLVSSDKTVNNITTLINSAKRYSFDGYCISDAAGILSSDTAASRTEAAETVSGAVAALATQKKLMLEGCNFNCLSRADSVIEIPFETQLEQNASYVAVPFLQTLLHSAIAYSGSPVNTAPIPTLLMLKYIEYGAALYFEWSFDSTSTLLYYNNSLSDAVKWYNDIENKLSDLTDDRIVSHSSVSENVFCTGYDCGSLIYVNYNNYSVNIGNISVPAYGFFRVN